MDLKTLMAAARKNQTEASTQKKIGYSTEIKPPKKLERSVNPDAIKTLLQRKKEIEKMQQAENLKKKQELVKLREDKKTTRKAKAMATRTKDNLKIFHGNHTNNQHKNNDVVLSPEAESKHKAFMKSLMTKNKHSDSDDSSSESYKNRKESLEKEKIARRKQEKYQNKARKSAKLDFKELLNLAHKQSAQAANESSSEESSDDDSSSEEMSAEARLAREKKKRKKLEAQLKALKRKSNTSSVSEPSFKIAKLDKGLSEESKSAKVKALMEKFKHKSLNKSGSDVDKTKYRTDKKQGANDKRNNTVPLKHQNGFKTSNSKKDAPPKDKKFSQSNNHSQSRNNNEPSKTVSKSFKKSDLDRRKVNGTNGVSKPKDKSSLNQMSKPALPAKKPTNPYAKLMEEAKANADRKCTLSVTSSVIRTNYPGVSMTDPKQATYEKLKGPSREMVAAFRRRQAMKEQGIHRRPVMLRDEVSDEEYDSEMEGFIDDGEGEVSTNAISAAIGKIFNYDKRKYGRESEYELSKMDASYKDIEREEKRSLKIAKQEDAIEAKRLLEEEERRKKRKK